MTEANGVRISGTAVRQAREAAGLSLRKLAVHANLKHSQISYAEKGIGGAVVIDRIAKALNKPVDSLLVAAGETAALDIGPPKPGDVVLLPFVKLRAAPYNARRSFPQESIQALAESILEHGQLQNITVRPLGDGTYEVITGGRRLAAIGWLCDEGRWDPRAATVRALIVAADDAKARYLSITENLQREDVNPMEEAEGFAALRDELGQSAAEIAAVLKTSKRHVEERIKVARGLHTTLKEAVYAGKLSITQARVLASAPDKVQLAMLKDVERRGYTTVDTLRHAVRAKLIPEARAAFPIEQYTGRWIEEDGARFFADVKQYDRLQQAAIAAKLAELQAEWAWVEKKDYFSGYLYQAKRSQDRKKAGAVLIVDRYIGKVTVEAGLIKRPVQTQRDWEAERKEVEQQRKAAHRFGAALSAKLLDDRETALRLAAFGVVSPHSEAVSTMQADVDLALGALCRGLNQLPSGDQELWEATMAAPLEQIIDVIAIAAANFIEAPWQGWPKGPPEPLASLAARYGVAFDPRQIDLEDAIAEAAP